MNIETLTLADLRAKNSNTSDIYYTTNSGQEGEWKYDPSDSTSIDNTGTVVVGPTGMRFKRIIEYGQYNVTWYGAIGDNLVASCQINTEAFQNASADVSKHGGELIIPPGHYFVGKQTENITNPKLPLFIGDSIIKINECEQPVRIVGNGAVLKYVPNLYFGSWTWAFDPEGGGIVFSKYCEELPQLNYGYRADIGNMIELRKNKKVEIIGLTLEGNIINQKIGCEWGDVGYQCTHFGIISKATESLHISDVTVSYFGQDGIYFGDDFDSPIELPLILEIENCTSQYNGRQGMSISCTDNATIINSQFNYTGIFPSLSYWVSAPGAGIDFESETGKIKNVTVINCKFLMNSGPGVMTFAPGTPTILDKVSNLHFIDCEFASSIAARGANPSITFENCNFFGLVDFSYVENIGNPSLRNAYSNFNKLTKFLNCNFNSVWRNNGYTYHFNDKLIHSGGSYIDSCHFEFSIPQDYTTHPQYIMNVTYSIISNSTIVFNAPGWQPHNSTIAYFYDIMSSNIQLINKTQLYANGWDIYFAYTNKNGQFILNNILLNKEIQTLPNVNDYW